MDSCLLCLEINKVLVNCIRVDSTQWLENDIKNLIEKHFWPLDTVESHSWLCTVCWQELSNFHKFYMRVEEAHLDFGRLMKSKDECKLLQHQHENEFVDEIYTNIEDFKDSFEKEEFIDCHLEPDILLDRSLSQASLVMEEEKFSIKEEPNEDLDKDNIVSKQKTKRKRSCKDSNNDFASLSEDPLEKSKPIKITKPKHKKTKAAKNANLSIDTIPSELVKEETQTINNVPDSLEIIKEPNISLDDDVYNDDNNSDTDSNYEPNTDSHQQNVESQKKIYYKHRTNRKDNDKFIAENFKGMFCDLCQAPLENFRDMHKHFEEKHEQKGYVICCTRKFFGRSLLVDHIHCHLNPDHFKCIQCGKVMSDRIRLEGHKRHVHGEGEIVNKHCCDVCGKSFREAHKLKTHKITHLTDEEKKFPCTECGKSYGSAYNLNYHIQAVHLKKFVKICHICGKSLSSSNDYKIHMDKHEGKPVPIISCDICGLRLTCERGLKRHKEAQHPVGGKKEHFCPICPKISPTLKALKKHINTMHEKGYDHKCTICDKGFKRSEALKEHMASHTGTALYTCPYCPKTFNSNGNMHSHRKKIHPKEWEDAKLQKYSGNLPAQFKIHTVTNDSNYNVTL